MAVLLQLGFSTGSVPAYCAGRHCRRHDRLRPTPIVFLRSRLAVVRVKQCLGLPKPLWHEVMELCGDWCAELSQIEIQKRTDLED